MLRELDCDHAQGFHMGRPMPVSELSSWSASWTSARRARALDNALLH